MSDINLKGCAVIDLSEYERLKSIERCILSGTIKSMIDSLNSHNTKSLEYKGLVLTKDSDGCRLYIPHSQMGDL